MTLKLRYLMSNKNVQVCEGYLKETDDKLYIASIFRNNEG